MELYWELMETPVEDDRLRLAAEILRIAKEEFYVLGVVMATEGYGVARNSFANVLDDMPESQIYFTPAGSGLGPFSSMVQSVRRLSSQEAAAIRPRVIQIVTVGSGDTVRSLANRMAYPSFQEERFRALNGLAAGDTLRAGQRVKLVVYGSRS
jgi:hypothetical protein